MSARRRENARRAAAKAERLAKEFQDELLCDALIALADAVNMLCDECEHLENAVDAIDRGGNLSRD